MPFYFSDMTQNKAELNKQFYALLKEIVDTQSAIISRLDTLSNKVDGKKPEDAVSASEAWARM